MGTTRRNSKTRVATPAAIDRTLREVDRRFRSSSRFVPAATLFAESYARVAPATLRELSALTRTQVAAGLVRLTEPLSLNRGVAENLFKIHQFTRLCAEQRAISGGSTVDATAGLPQDVLDGLTKRFPSTTPARADEWDYAGERLARLGVRDVLDNDWYKFKMAAVIFTRGLHESKRVTYTMFSRGKANRAYYVVGGTSLAIDAIPYFRFREDEVQYLMRHPQFVKVDPAFFAYLRTWTFRGSIRALPEGSIAFANETIMEVTSDPLSATLIECLLSPIVDTVTTSATKVSRIVTAAGGLPVVEGGTRRSGHALLGAYGAMIGLATGTSNAKVSELLGTLPYGSMEHALFGLFPNELRTMLAYDELFPNSTFLVDENDVVEGLRTAVRAAGRGMGGARTDSEMPGLGLGGTTLAMRQLLHDFEYYDPKILVSNRIDEDELLKWTPETSAYQSVLVGTQAQSPSDANGSNIVFKLVEVTDLATGVVKPIAKRSVGKVGIPGRTDVYRVLAPVDPHSTADHLEMRAVHDVITVRGENVENGVPLLLDALGEDGVRRLPRVSIAEGARRTRAQLALFSADVLDPRAKRDAYAVVISDSLRAKTERVLSDKTARPYRVGVQIGSFDPVTDAHVRIAERTRKLYGFDRLIAVPANQTPVHGKTYVYGNDERVEMLRKRYEPLGLEVDEREVRGITRFTYDTLRAIDAEVKATHAGARVYVVVGEDVFLDLVDQSERGRWRRNQRELLGGDFSWVVHRRVGDGRLNVPHALLDADWERLSPNHFENVRTGAVIESVDLNVGLQISSTKERALAAEVDTIFHGVDLQWTFWEAIDNRPPGALAVPGSGSILANVLTLTKLAHAEPRVKSILTKDFHHEIERRDAKWNGEFHPPFSFPPHGMALRGGPAGHEILWEVRSIFGESVLDIPHHQEIRGPSTNEDALALKPWDLSQHAHQILDPRVQVVLQKNGPRSYDFGENPRARTVVDKIEPKRVYVYGVATDFCVRAAALRYREWGYETFVVVDAIAGIDPGRTKDTLAEWTAAGVRFVRTADVIGAFTKKE